LDQEIRDKGTTRLLLLEYLGQLLEEIKDRLTNFNENRDPTLRLLEKCLSEEILEVLLKIKAT